jgi:tetratricopeptide (TPR) repeat protein
MGSAPVLAATDQARDLDRLAAEIAECAAPPGPLDAEAATRLASLRVNRASLSGDLAELRRADAALDEALERFGPWPDLCFLRASLHLKQHRLAEASAALAEGDGLAASPDGRAVQADVDLQLGRYAEARAAYERLAAETPAWDNLARLAHFEGLFGDARTADDLYARSAGELTAKELRSYAWVESHRGRLHLRHGRVAEAEHHCELAARAYSGHWLVDRDLAAVRAAQGRLEEAAALVEDAAARTGRPELAQAAGDLLARFGADAEAGAWHERALAGYLESVRLGEVQYLHHLAEYHADVAGDGQAALPWAERDHALRPHHATHAALAWALHLSGRRHEAAEAAGRVLATGLRDPLIVRRMQMVRAAHPRE